MAMLGITCVLVEQRYIQSHGAERIEWCTGNTGVESWGRVVERSGVVATTGSGKGGFILRAHMTTPQRAILHNFRRELPCSQP